MLVVLNGAESINKSIIARDITYTLNGLANYQLDTFTVDFTTTPIVARNASGVVVYQEGDDTSEGITTLLTENANDAVILERIKTLAETLVSMSRFGCLGDSFGDILQDWGLDNKPNYEGNYQSIVDWYTNRSLPHCVIYGTFSQTFIDQLVSDVGEREVVVVNITRNPSVQYQLYRIGKVDISEAVDGVDGVSDKLFTAIVNNIKHKQSGKRTIRYEDMINDGFFKFAGVTVKTPKEFIRYNDVLTANEYAKLSAELPLQVDEFNQKINNLAKLRSKAGLPTDVFGSLGYTPLSREETLNL